MIHHSNTHSASICSAPQILNALKAVIATDLRSSMFDTEVVSALKTLGLF